MAALYVACSHAFLLTLDPERASLPPALFKVTDWLGDGEIGVAAFIVVSGYCLMLPVLRTPNWTLPGGFGRFIARRARRIIPPYYVALVLSVGLYVLSERIAGRHVGVHKLVPHVAAHVMLIHNLFSAGGAHYFNAALWSVALEWQIYFAFGLLLLPLTRLLGLLPTLVLTCGIGVVPRFLLHGVLDWTAPWFVGLFVAGMGAAAIVHSPRPRFRELAARIPWATAFAIAVALTALILALQTTENREGFKVVEDLAAGVTVALGLAAAGVGLATGSRRAAPLATFFSSKPLAVTGSFSYSIYLIHWPILVLCVTVMRRAGLPATAQFALEIGLVVPLATLLAYIFFLVAERPFVSSFRRVATERELSFSPLPQSRSGELE